MKFFKSIAITALALAFQRASGQSYIHYSLNWSEVVEGTTMPVNSPDGILEPGESVRFRVSIDFTPIGTLVPYQPPVFAPVAGLENAIFGLGSTVVQSGVAWSEFVVSHGFSGERGTALPPGALAGCQVFQPFPPPGMNPIPTDPLLNVWQVNWTPPSYDSRWVTYRLAYTSEGNDLFVRTGTDPNGHATYDIVSAPFDLGLPVNIPIVPSPGAAGIFVLSAIAAAHRKRPGALTEAGSRKVRPVPDQSSKSRLPSATR